MRGTRARWPLQSSRCALVALALATLLVPLLDVAASLAAADLQQGEEVAIIRRFDVAAPAIVLTFDAGADRGFAAEILDILAAENVPATFGMTGVWAEDNPDLVVRMVDEGHHLINHSWDHPNFTEISSSARFDQLQRTEELVFALTGVRMTPYFRPPFGAYDASVLDDLAAGGYTTMLLWTVDTLGWDGYSATQITQRVLDGAAPGAVMLMHVGAASQDAAALPGIIAELRAQGYHFATAEELGGAVDTGERFFPETGHTVSANFLAYWQRFGGLELFGYPLTEELQEDGRAVQYFERARFELHPGSWPERYDVLLGRLGYLLVETRIAMGEEPFQPVVAGSDENCTFHPGTEHRLCFAFRDFWQSHGGLEIFGFPLSEEFSERNPDDGALYTVQYFERARFEWHPDAQGGTGLVLLGRLGAQVQPE